MFLHLLIKWKHYTSEKYRIDEVTLSAGYGRYQSLQRTVNYVHQPLTQKPEQSILLYKGVSPLLRPLYPVPQQGVQVETKPL
jgi:hypothetical protein